MCALCARWDWPDQRLQADRQVQGARRGGLGGTLAAAQAVAASPAETEVAVMDLRARHPAWGGRKIAKRLEAVCAVAASTVTGILRRNGFELGRFGGGAKAFVRFEHERPNDLWQMDFKGHVEMRRDACIR